MKNKKKELFTLLCLCLIGWHSCFGQETFKVMFYNVLNFPDQAPASRIDNLENIMTDYQPDLFMVCEINTIQGSNTILSMLQGIKPEYAGANFVNNTSDDTSGNQNDLQNMLYYNSSKFILESQTEVTTIFRDFNHYVLKLNTVNQDTNPIILNAIVCHLKSSSGSENQAFRLQMVNDLVAYLDTLPSDELVLIGGDLNLYTQSEPAFQELIDPTNNITFVDPADRIGSWHTNLVFVDVFTQSTRTQTGLGGATGGFDDRFDFIMTSENMLTSSDLFYVDDSYQVYGNNANSDCFNQEINSSDCSGPDFDQAIRNELYFMSDHLPVTVELQTNEQLLSTQEIAIISPIRILGSNLVENWLNLSIDSSINSKTNDLVLYNTMGQILARVDIRNLNQVRLNVSNWSSGIYYIGFNDLAIQPIKFIKR